MNKQDVLYLGFLTCLSNYSITGLIVGLRLGVYTNELYLHIKDISVTIFAC